MAYTINTNIASMQAQEYLRVTTEFQQKTINRVTSGLRIVASGDDAAGLAIANGFRSDLAVLSQGVRNANDGLSTLQTIDGGINNISKLLDRARTLATQSASGTFTGSRSVLNSEFQSVLGEIDRQAQAIGLNQNGDFAKSLAVFIGGGRAAGADGAGVISNGSVAVDLRSSTVDAKSLGLKGVQAVGVSGTDIGVGSANTSVAQILADSNNTTRTNGYTDFYFAGAGFSGSDKVKVSVNTQNVTDTATLVSAINSAIKAAGDGGTQAATAFKNANVVASINTDSNGKQQLAFSSSTAAFQVTAGDKMANALMGNFQAGSEGKATTTTLTGAANLTMANTAAADRTVQMRFQGGGMASPVTLSVSIASGADTQTAVNSLSSAVSSNAALQAAGITLAVPSDANPLVFSSAVGEKFDIQVTGDVDNLFGMGSFIAGGTGEFDYTTRTGAAYNNATAHGTATLQFSINGAASSGNAVSVDLNGGDATAGKVTGTQSGGTVAAADVNGLTVQYRVNGGDIRTFTFGSAATTIAGAAAQMIAGGLQDGAVASLNASGQLEITSGTKGAASTVEITGGTALTALGLGIGAGATAGTSRSGASIVSALNDAFAGDAELRAADLKATWGGGAVTIASQNDTYFRMNTVGGAEANIGFGVTGTSFTGNTVAAAAAKNFNSGGAANSQAIDFTAIAYGSNDQTITISANDANGNQQSKSIVLRNDATARNARTIDEAVNTINAALRQTNNPTLQNIVAVKENVGGTEKINFLSTNKSFSVSIGSTADANGLGSQGTTVTSQDLAGGSVAGIDTQDAAQRAVSVLSQAVSKLGDAQAVVGKGQNQFNYAIGLAQTQITNISAAESRIRDADLAAEAANLTKAQILQQAGIAALAQANSAPQAVLSLLRG